MEKIIIPCIVCGQPVERSQRIARALCFKCKTEKQKNRDAEKKILEKDIQREICDYLAEKGVFFWRSNNIPVFGRSGDGIKRFRALPKYTPRGLPDIMCLVAGKFIGLEVKRPDNPSKTGSDFQVQFASRLLANGGMYAVVFSLQNVKDIPDLWK